MYSIRSVYHYTSIHCDISYTIIRLLYEVVYSIPVSAYTSIRLYEYPLIRVSAAPKQGRKRPGEGGGGHRDRGSGLQGEDRSKRHDPVRERIPAQHQDCSGFRHHL